MGNCLPKLKKNKVSPEPTVSAKKKKETNISEILSFSSRSASNTNTSWDEELEVIKELTVSDVHSTSVESLVMKKEETALEELKPKEPTPIVQKPVFFQVDYVQGMPHRMPSRLAERMEQKVDVKKMEELTLTEEDEDFMDEIVDEVEAKELLELQRERQKITEYFRGLHLQAIREKAGAMGSGRARRVEGRMVWDFGLREAVWMG